jgi:hypothetical protein
MDVLKTTYHVSAASSRRRTSGGAAGAGAASPRSDLGLGGGDGAWRPHAATVRATRYPILSHHDNIVFERQSSFTRLSHVVIVRYRYMQQLELKQSSFTRLSHVVIVRYRYMQQLELKLAHDRRTAGRNKYGVQGAHFNPLGLFLRTFMPFIWRILSACRPA